MKYNIASVSAIKLYKILIWIETGRTSGFFNGRIPKKQKEYIVEHFKLEYNSDTNTYDGDEDIVFEILKTDYAKVFEKKKIISYSQLLYYAGAC